MLGRIVNSPKLPVRSAYQTTLPLPLLHYCRRRLALLSRLAYRTLPASLWAALSERLAPLLPELEAFLARKARGEVDSDTVLMLERRIREGEAISAICQRRR